jgi:hypothetical protein
MPIRYSRGANIHDANPAQLEAVNWTAFKAALAADRAEQKEGAAYFCAPLSNGRSKGSVQPAWFLTLDIDTIADTDTGYALRLWLAGRFRGIGWPTP